MEVETKASFTSSDIKTLNQGTLTLTVIAKDVAGNQINVTNNTIIYDSIDPDVSMLQPTNGTILRGIAEANSIINIYLDNLGTTWIGTGTADINGNFTITYTTQTNGTTIYKSNWYSRKWKCL